MTEWTFAVPLRDLTRRKKMLVAVGDQQVALFYINDQVYALRDICIHKERQLSKGTVLHGHVICPGHQWSFDPATGYVDEQDRCQPTYDVRVEDGAVYVDPRPVVRIHDFDGIGSV
jgi:nitrite reductase/ring-hydroxylating ferredoxin subunit